MKIIKCFLILQFLTIVLFPNLSFSKNLTIPSSIEFELTNSEYNKYLTRSMRAYTDGEIYGDRNIKKKYKKWVNAKILINGKSIDSKIRILGDWKDHLRPPVTSLKVKTINGSFNGVTRFNLFLPETRKGENEVFWTLMLNYLGFPSLYTRMVQVNLNGNIYKAIFQEDATKEFLERNNLTETVILKYNDFVFYLNNEEQKIYQNFFTSSFVIDNNNFLKNDTANFIASEAIALKANSNFDKQVLNEQFFKLIHKKYAYHGLATINRKYIYIPYKKLFIPLYYDGNVQFLPGKNNCTKKLEIKTLSSFKKDFNALTGKNLTKMQECVLGEIFDLSKNNLNKQSNFFPNKKFDNQKNLDYEKIKNKIINFLSKNEINKNESSIKNNNRGLIYSFIFNDNFYKCFLNIDNKKIIFCDEINGLAYSKLISESGRFKRLKNFKSFPINLGSFNNELPIIWLDRESSEYTIKDKGTYYFIRQNENDKNLKFIFQNSEAKLFIQGNFENVNFEFKSEFEEKKKELNEVRYDKNLLTGCVNFFDTDFKNVSLKSLNMTCEDSINIKNSKGTISQIFIDHSNFDALDLDFSKVKINKLLINNANNDCADFSFGVYEIISANLKNCGDKGFSVGERSILNLVTGNIFYSNIGIASKDEAITNVKNLNMENMNTCLAAYNKKKEFKGSEMTIKNFNCKQYKTLTEIDNLSKINIAKRN